MPTIHTQGSQFQLLEREREHNHWSQSGRGQGGSGGEKIFKDRIISNDIEQS